MQQMNLVMVPLEELTQVKSTQEEILKQIQNLQIQESGTIPREFITAKEFMVALRMCRGKCDELIASSKIKTIKKKRKIYVPFSVIQRYFTDPSIQ